MQETEIQNPRSGLKGSFLVNFGFTPTVKQKFSRC